MGEQNYFTIIYYMKDRAEEAKKFNFLTREHHQGTVRRRPKIEDGRKIVEEARFNDASTSFGFVFFSKEFMTRVLFSVGQTPGVNASLFCVFET